MRNPLAWDSFGFWLLVGVIIPVLPVLVTFATGYLYMSSGLGGFPAPWARLVFQPCPLIACREICYFCDMSKIIGVSVDWLPLGVDVLFYAGIGYSMILVFSRARP